VQELNPEIFKPSKKSRFKKISKKVKNLMTESTTTLGSFGSSSYFGLNQTQNQSRLSECPSAKILKSENSNFSKNSEKLDTDITLQNQKATLNNKRVKMMIIDNLLNFISNNLDKKLTQIEKMSSKNQKNLNKAKNNYDKVEKKVLAFKVSQKGGAI
jgi:hypothetical protein